MSTSLVVSQPKNLDLKDKSAYMMKWKNRGTYGAALRMKLEYLMKLFEGEANKKENFNIDTIMSLSRTIDFNISIQLSNIRAVEEIKALKDLEKWKNELISKLGNQGSQTSVSVTWKY